MKHIITALIGFMVLVAVVIAADTNGTIQQKIVPTSQFSREALTNETAAGWRTKLGVGTGAVTNAVTNVNTGLGLTGGPITTNGTISADTNVLTTRTLLTNIFNSYSNVALQTTNSFVTVTNIVTLSNVLSAVMDSTIVTTWVNDNTDYNTNYSVASWLADGSPYMVAYNSVIRMDTGIPSYDGVSLTTVLGFVDESGLSVTNLMFEMAPNTQTTFSYTWESSYLNGGANSLASGHGIVSGIEEIVPKAGTTVYITNHYQSSLATGFDSIGGTNIAHYQVFKKSNVSSTNETTVTNSITVLVVGPIMTNSYSITNNFTNSTPFAVVAGTNATVTTNGNVFTVSSTAVAGGGTVSNAIAPLRINTGAVELTNSILMALTTNNAPTLTNIPQLGVVGLIGALASKMPTNLPLYMLSTNDGSTLSNVYDPRVVSSSGKMTAASNTFEAPNLQSEIDYSGVQFTTNRYETKPALLEASTLVTNYVWDVTKQVQFIRATNNINISSVINVNSNIPGASLFITASGGNRSVTVPDSWSFQSSYKGSDIVEGATIILNATINWPGTNVSSIMFGWVDTNFVAGFSQTNIDYTAVTNAPWLTNADTRAVNFATSVSSPSFSGANASISSISGVTIAASGGLSGGVISGVGSGITGLNASSLASGTVPDARLPDTISSDITGNAATATTATTATSATTASFSTTAGTATNLISVIHQMMSRPKPRLLNTGNHTGANSGYKAIIPGGQTGTVHTLFWMGDTSAVDYLNTNRHKMKLYGFANSNLTVNAWIAEMLGCRYQPASNLWAVRLDTHYLDTFASSQSVPGTFHTWVYSFKLDLPQQCTNGIYFQLTNVVDGGLFTNGYFSALYDTNAIPAGLEGFTTYCYSVDRALPNTLTNFLFETTGRGQFLGWSISWSNQLGQNIGGLQDSVGHVYELDGYQLKYSGMDDERGITWFGDIVDTIFGEFTGQTAYKNIVDVPGWMEIYYYRYSDALEFTNTFKVWLNTGDQDNYSGNYWVIKRP